MCLQPCDQALRRRVLTSQIRVDRRTMDALRKGENGGSVGQEHYGRYDEGNDPCESGCGHVHAEYYLPNKSTTGGGRLGGSRRCTGGRWHADDDSTAAEKRATMPAAAPFRQPRVQFLLQDSAVRRQLQEIVEAAAEVDLRTQLLRKVQHCLQIRTMNRIV
jgi:hypothetical protein